MTDKTAFIRGRDFQFGCLKRQNTAFVVDDLFDQRQPADGFAGRWGVPLRIRIRCAIAAAV